MEREDEPVERSAAEAHTRVLHNVQLLRGVAALSVVYFHTTSAAGLNLDWSVGSRGVDIFFVVSGFIIPYIGTRRPAQFFRRRVIRLVPFYWAATMLAFAMVAIAPGWFRSTDPSISHLIASLLFIPHESARGEMVPTLLLGWSLNLEMWFYVVFAVALRISQRRAPLVAAAWIAAYVIVIRVAGWRNPIVAFYGQPIVLEFCYGVGVFYLFGWCSARAEAVRHVGALKFLLIVTVVGGLIALNVMEGAYRDEIPRQLAAGIPACFAVASALLLEQVYGLAARQRLVALLGGASYILYLVHPYIVYAVLRLILTGAGAFSSPAVVVLIAGLLALTSTVAIAIHVWWEMPVMAFLRAKLIASGRGD